MSTLPVTIDNKQRNATIAEICDDATYFGYRSHRQRLTDWSAERVMVMFVRLGIGNLHDVQRWEARYQEEVVAP